MAGFFTQIHHGVRYRCILPDRNRMLYGLQQLCKTYVIMDQTAARQYDLAEFARVAPAEAQASPRWYRTPIDKKTLKSLMQKRDAPAIRDTVLLYGLMAASASFAIMMMPHFGSVFFWMIYGVLYASAGDSRWHECGHRTAFKTGWMNSVVYQISCFMIMRNPVTWKYSHARHHTDTIIAGRDFEIALMRPPKALHVVLNFCGIPDIIDAFRRMFIHATGKLAKDEATFIPPEQAQRAFLISRLWLVIYGVIIALSIMMQSFVPLLLIGGPRLYGSWHFNMTGLLQHGGLDENVADFRLNTRTVYMNFVSRFIYLNMNYHLEHHMYPAVPYYNLPKLHALLKHDLPEPTSSIWAGYAEMMPILMQQLRGRDVHLERSLPTSS